MTRFELRWARIVTQAVSLLLVGGGVFHIWSAAHGRIPGMRFLPGMFTIVVGVGVWQRRWWGRWFALGACYLAIVAACVLPVWWFLVRPFEGLDSSFTSNIVRSLIALAIGAVGYQGLSYFRSDAGRREFSANPQAEEKLLAERSSAVVYSAAAWVAALMIVHNSGSLGSWISRLASRDTVVIDTSRERAAAEIAASRGSDANRADLVPLGLCSRIRGSARALEIAYANVGPGSNAGIFRLAVADSWDRGGLWLDGRFPVPPPGKILSAPYEFEAEETRKRVMINLDPENDVHELDKDNNVAQFEIQRDATGALVLPSCDSVQLPAIAPRERAARAGPPDLVAVGLCGRGPVQVSVRFTNRGGPMRGHFWISQGRTPDDLAVVDQVYLSVPHYHEVRGFTVGDIATLIGKRGASAEVTVKIDSHDVILETDETNNFARARITRLADGTVDLPDCDALDDKYYETGAVAENALQPAFVALPDLIPLGLCMRDWGADTRFIEVAYGNVGTVRGPGPLRIVTGYEGDPARSWHDDNLPVPAPGGVLLAQFALKEQEARGRLLVEVDPENGVNESAEANNTAGYPLARRPDGTLDMPDCNSIGALVSNWNGRIQPMTGPE